jgi:hypothetical protein
MAPGLPDLPGEVVGVPQQHAVHAVHRVRTSGRSMISIINPAGDSTVSARGPARTTARSGTACRPRGRGHPSVQASLL